MEISRIGRLGTSGLMLALAAIFLSTNPAEARHRGRRAVCSETAELQLGACFAEVVDNHYTTAAFCINDRENRRDCLRDVVTSDELLVEDTDDWFGIATNGDIAYCGEEVKDYDYFEGDNPPKEELTAIDGRSRSESVSRNPARLSSAIRRLGRPIASNGTRETPRTSARCSRTITASAGIRSSISLFPRISRNSCAPTTIHAL